MKAESVYQVKIIKEFNEFILLENSWSLLCQSSVDLCPMVTHGWLAAWWKTFGAQLEMHLVTIWEGESLIAAAPLAVQQKRWGVIQHKILLGWVNVWVDRYLWLIDQKHPMALLSILNYLNENKKHWDELYLQRLPIDVLQYKEISDYFIANCCWVMCQDDLQSPTLVLTDNYQELMGSLSTSFRQSLRRKVRTIEKREEVSMWIVEDATCEQAIAIISPETWQHEQGTSIVSTSEIQGFFHDVIAFAAKEKNLLVPVMTIDNEYAAFELNLKCRNRLYNLKLGYKFRFSDLSPGLVLKDFILRSLIDKHENIVEYDLMGTAEAYKLNWTKKIRSHQALRILPKNVNNIFWQLKYNYKDWLKEYFPAGFAFLKFIKISVFRRED